MTARMTVLRASGALIGSRLDPVSDIEVSITNGRIESITPAGQSSRASLIILDGLWLLPGFIDSHVHIALTDPRKVLFGGVTTVRDLGWPPESIRQMARDSEAEGFAGPRILTAGPMLTCENGYPTRAGWAPHGTGRVVVDEGDAEIAVAERAAEGSSIVKIALNAEVGPTLGPETLAAICSHAHARGLRVTAHIYGLEELVKALDAGVDELAHMLMSPEVIPNDLLDRMVEQKIVVVPTLGIFPHRSVGLAVANLARFAEHGGTVVYGTDLGNQGPRPGIDPTEVRRMAEAGLRPIEIIASATTATASVMSLSNKGQLEPGMDADIIGVHGDPREDVRRLGAPGFVMRAGIPWMVTRWAGRRRSRLLARLRGRSR
jgi:imidazolonepropionase-like amidohydrolase